MKRTIKRIVAGLAALLVIASIVVMFIGCTSTKISAKTVNDENIFVYVKRDYYCEIVYHKDTKVMYVVSMAGNNAGSYTLLVNADGTPMIWEG